MRRPPAKQPRGARKTATTAPGSFVVARERWGRAEHLLAQTPPDFVIADARVLELHSALKHSLASIQHVALRAGEGAKSLAAISRLTERTTALPRGATIAALGGGTIGDLATVFAHLHKRGARLIQIPTTLLAAVDSSVGGKGAVNAAGVKNLLGVFHSAEETWLCPELFTTLSEGQIREGQLEAWKTVIAFDAKEFARWQRRPPTLREAIAVSRRLKTQVCERDPYDVRDIRAGLNFGHTFGHVIESLSKFRIPHGEAIGLGMLCALDVGRKVGATPPKLAAQIESALPNPPWARQTLARVLGRSTPEAIATLLSGDKKGATSTSVRFVLLTHPGRWRLDAVAHGTWQAMLPSWERARVP